jgi:UDP-N-acetylmuramoyl-L-alanyl-D-glutamate--2,6-diaminopimelate ligase
MKKTDFKFEDSLPTPCDNSKSVEPGSMFFALSKNEDLKKKHIDEAIANGAKIIVVENGEKISEAKNGVKFISVENVRIALAKTASEFFGSNFDYKTAVTGTNGKSSTADILRQIWITSGIEAASIGTLGVITKTDREKLPHNMTSPDCLELHKILHKLCKREIKNIVLEATSQGLDQHRLDPIKFDVCAFTNFSRDHLDYHKTTENYLNAKMRLFSESAHEKSVFIVNADDPCSEKIREIAKNRGVKCVDYGHAANDIKILGVNPEESNQQVSVDFFGTKISFALPLPGTFQIHNAMCAAAASYFSGVSVEKIFEGLEKLQQIDGRLELVAKNIYVDYAHTPDALQNAILSLKNLKKNRMITVFGCGGNRDKEKRILMGRVAEKFSDVVIVTDDNPRDEDPQQIRKMILEGCPNAGEIGDRKIAIESAVKMLSEGDVLLVAGKGHETYQIIGKELQESDDKKIITDAVKK